MSDLTRMLDSIDQGDPHAAEDLLPLVYEELRKLASARIAGEMNGSTLQGTALVHEAWLRLVGAEQQTWENRGHFFAAAAEAMRRILIDRARGKQALKRGAGAKPIDLATIDVAASADDQTLLAVHEALEKLALEDKEAAELVKLRFFAGLSYEEAGRTMNISPRSAQRCWTFARVWLYNELSRAEAK